MKKPLIVILIIGLIPVILLAIGLFVSHNKPQDNSISDDLLYPYTDNATQYEGESRNLIVSFFTDIEQKKDTLHLFKDDTLDQLKYSNVFETQLEKLLSNIISAKLLDLNPFEINSWTSSDHIYLVTYQLNITDNSLTMLGSNGVNNKLFLVSKIDTSWFITDISEAP
jgi:hypothetical protein